MHQIRLACPEDSATIVELIRQLAIYEKLEDEARATPESIRDHLFGPRPYAEALIAEVDGQAVGFALFFHNFSTFRGQPGLYLEDLFVLPEFRGRGIGKALFSRVGQIALERGCGRYEWSVLDWNQPSIDFYKSFGASPMDDWTVFRIDGESLQRFSS